MDADMRRVEVEEVEAAKANTEQFPGFRVEALDVTKLSLMRPDGHPGPYMHPFPFANGVKDRVQNDCVHWCLPGPVDTWNQILLEVGCLWVTRDHPNQLYLAYQGRNLQDRALSNREGWKKFRKDSDDACHFAQCFTSPAARWCPLTTYMPMSMWTTYHGLRPDYNHHPPGNIW
uniref:Trichome birefringence-like C-terminal domain-containing protein n=1 Tax=Vitis vinifera TaxID=29760 RepID=A5B1V3_VITVI|nr:hypothetical protein VITISV_013946 [Vitis vinifera]